MESPFVFVSYCSANNQTVWEDVVHLQEQGFNVWIDEPNLDKTNDSWRDDARQAINNFNCELVLFYISKESLLSGPCLSELKEASSDTTMATHNGNPVKIVVVEVERIPDLDATMNQIYLDINVKQISSGEKGGLACVLSGFKDVFCTGNDKVRIHAKNSVSSHSDFYEDVKAELVKCKRRVFARREKIYRLAVTCIVKRAYREATRLLLICANNQYYPAVFLLAHLVYTKTATADCRYTQDQLWKICSSVSPVHQWKNVASDYAKNKMYSEALGYALTHGEYCRDAKSFAAASKLWLHKKCLDEAQRAMQMAQSINPKSVENSARTLNGVTQEELEKRPDTEKAIL